MADPPSYEDSTSEHKYESGDLKEDAKFPQRFSIREEVELGRSQHVAALVARLLPQIRDRAKQGLAKSVLLLLTSNQDSSRKGQLVGYSEAQIPILIQLEGLSDTLEFWMQQEALDQLQSQMLAALSDNVQTHVERQSLPERSTAPVAKPSFFSRKPSKALETAPVPKPGPAPVTVDVQLDEAYFRTENEYGLYETLRGRCVLVEVDVR